jgi:hypothetical protein
MSIVAGNVALAFFFPRLKETSDTQTPQTSGPPSWRRRSALRTFGIGMNPTRQPRPYPPRW